MKWSRSGLSKKVCLVLFAFVSACKPAPDKSRLNTLDNFAGLSDHVNSCQSDPAKQYEPSDFPMLENIRFLGDEVEENEIVFRQSLTNAVVNIPSAIQKIFVKAGGKVVIADNSTELCKPLSQGVRSEESDSCIVFISADKEHGQILNLVLPAKLSSVHHNLMRLAAMFIVDVLPLADQSRKLVVSEFMARNSIEFVEDLYLSKSFDGKKVLRETAGSSVGQRLLDARSKGGKLDVTAINRTLTGEGDSSKSLDLSRKIFIESLDSYFCNTWAPAPSGAIAEIRSGKLAKLSSVKNTRAVMEALFPKSYKFYAQKIENFLSTITSTEKQVSAPAFLVEDSEEATFALGGGSKYPYNRSNYWDMTTSSAGAFGKSLFWDQTTKPIVNAYKGYSDRVQNQWSSGRGLVGGYVGAAAGAYQDNIVRPAQARGEAVFNQQIQGGATTNQAFRNTLAVELLRPTGATAVAETASLGQRFDGSKYKDGFERAGEFSMGVAGVASTVAVPLSFMPKGAVPWRAGMKTPLAEANANSRVLESIGVESSRANRYGSAFESGARTRTLPAGSSLYRYGTKANPWFTPELYRDPINSLALPPGSEAGASEVGRFVTTKPVTVVEGGVSRQPQWATPGNRKLGGGKQFYMNYSDVTGGAVRSVPLQTTAGRVIQQVTVPTIGGSGINGSTSKSGSGGR